MAESSSLPLGAVVVLSDGADNAGGIGRDTIAAIRRQRVPVHTIGFGNEHPDRDVEIQDAVLPARALPQSRLNATVTLRSYGVSGAKTRLSVHDGGKVLARREISSTPMARCRAKPWFSIVAMPGRSRWKSPSMRFPASPIRRIIR